MLGRPNMPFLMSYRVGLTAVQACAIQLTLLGGCFVVFFRHICQLSFVSAPHSLDVTTSRWYRFVPNDLDTAFCLI